MLDPMLMANVKYPHQGCELNSEQPCGVICHRHIVDIRIEYLVGCTMMEYYDISAYVRQSCSATVVRL